MNGSYFIACHFISISIMWLYLMETTYSMLTLYGQFHQIETHTPLCGNEYITVKLCIGSKANNQCVDLLYDINHWNIIIGDINIDRVYGYNSNKSSTFSEGLKRKYTIDSPTAKLFGEINFESIYFEKEEDTFDKFRFIRLFNISSSIDFHISAYNFIGVFGVNLKYSLFNPKENSLLYLLFENKKIQTWNISHRYLNRDQMVIQLGDANKDNYIFCPSSRSGYEMKGSWHCIIREIRGMDNHIISTYNSLSIVFDTSKKTIEAPDPFGFEVFGYYMKYSNSCVVKNDQLSSHYLACERSEIGLLPEITFKLHESDMEIKWKPKEVFDEEGKSKITIVKYSTVWTLNLSVLKNYDMYFDNDNGNVGFREHKIFENKIKGMDTIIKGVFCFNCFLCFFGTVINWFKLCV